MFNDDDKESQLNGLFFASGFVLGIAFAYALTVIFK
jgi:hypothetical protein